MQNPLDKIMGETADSLQDIKQDTEKVMNETRAQFEGKEKKEKKKKGASPASSDGAHDDF